MADYKYEAETIRIIELSGAIKAISEYVDEFSYEIETEDVLKLQRQLKNAIKTADRIVEHLSSLNTKEDREAYIKTQKQKDRTVYEVSTTDEGQTDYRTAYWWEVRPLMDITRLPERITVSNTADVDYRNTTIESLLFNYYHFGVDMDPDYQRGLVWDERDKEYLLDSVFHDGIEIGRFVFICLSDEEQVERDYTYEILDGKQRLNCLCEFYENRFSYKGLYFNDLNPYDKNTFFNKKIAIGEARDLTREEKLQLFLAVNRGGKAMNDTHMKQVEDMLYEEEVDYDMER